MSQGKEAERFVESVLRQVLSRANPPSSMGSQLESMRTGMNEVTGSNPFRHEERAHAFAIRLLIWNSMSERAQEALVIRNLPMGWTNGWRLVLEDDLIVDTNYEEDGKGMLQSRQREPVDEEREAEVAPPPGHRWVRTSKPKLPTTHDVARVMCLSERQVRTAISRAYDTIRNHPLFPLVSR